MFPRRFLSPELLLRIYAFSRHGFLFVQHRYSKRSAATTWPRALLQILEHIFCAYLTTLEDTTVSVSETCECSFERELPQHTDNSQPRGRA